MKRFCMAVLLAVLLLTGCGAEKPEKTVSVDIKPSESASESVSQETVSQETPPPGESEPEQKTEKPGKKPGKGSGKREPEESETEKPEPDAGEGTAENPSEPEEASEAPVRAQWAEEALNGLSDYDRVKLGLDEEEPLVYFSSDETVEDFKILSLTLESVDEDGTLHFSIEESEGFERITPEAPALVRMEMMGTIPNNGISYRDPSGKTRYFAIEVSGYDGSLLLTEFTPE